MGGFWMRRVPQVVDEPVVEEDPGQVLDPAAYGAYGPEAGPPVPEPQPPAPGPSIRSIDLAGMLDRPRPTPVDVPRATVKGGLKEFGKSLIPGYAEARAREDRAARFNATREDAYEKDIYDRRMMALQPLLQHDQKATLEARDADAREAHSRRKYPNAPESWHWAARMERNPPTEPAKKEPDLGDVYSADLGDGKQVLVRRGPQGGFVDEQNGAPVTGVRGIYRIGTQPQEKPEGSQPLDREQADLEVKVATGVATPADRARLAAVKKARTTVGTTMFGLNAPVRNESRLDRLAREFKDDPVVKEFKIVQEAGQFVRAMDPNKNDPALDQALLYSFAKIMDPGSVVREGEYRTVQRYAQSWLDNFKIDAMSVLDRQAVLTPKARAQLKNVVLARANPRQQQYRALREQYGKRLDSIGGPGAGNEYLQDMEAAFPEPVSGGGTGSAVEKWERGPDGTLRKVGTR